MIKNNMKQIELNQNMVTSVEESIEPQHVNVFELDMDIVLRISGIEKMKLWSPICLFIQYSIDVLCPSKLLNGCVSSADVKIYIWHLFL